MAQTRYYSDTAVDTTLALSISDSATSVVVDAVTGFPPSYPYTLVIDQGTENEELLNVTAAAGTTLTVTRGYAGTGAVAHTVGAAISHVFTGSDATAANAHAGASAAVHGVTGDVVGDSDTQTLSNKTIDGTLNTLQNIPEASVTGLTAALAALQADIDLNESDGDAADAALQADIDLRQLSSEKGAANGYASLDASTLVPFAQLPTGTTASTVSEGDHTHEVASATSVETLTARTLFDGNTDQVLASFSLTPGTYMVFAECEGCTLNATTATRWRFKLGYSGGTATLVGGQGVVQQSDALAIQGGGTVAGLLVVTATTTAQFLADKVGSGAQAVTSTTGSLVAVPLSAIQ